MNQPIKKSPKTSYYIRIAAGGYLLYIAYSLISDWAQVKEEHKLAIGAAIVVFALAGFVLCLVSALSLNKLNRTHTDSETDTGVTDEQTEQLEFVNTEADGKETDSKEADGKEAGVREADSREVD